MPFYQETLWRMKAQEWVYSPRQDPAHATAASWSLYLVFDAQSQIVISFLVTQDTKPEFALLLSCFIKKLITGWLTFFQFDCLTPLCCLDSWQTVIASKALKIFQQHLPGNQIHHQVVNHQQNPCGRNLWPLRSEQNAKNHKPSTAEETPIGISHLFCWNPMSCIPLIGNCLNNQKSSSYVFLSTKSV